MNAMEKVAWTELVVSVAAVVLVTALVPWLGARASAGFAVMALAAVGVVFLRQRGNRVVHDERDREIQRKSTAIGVGLSWMTLLASVAVATVWSSYLDVHAVSAVFLNWLVWIQFPICYGAKGLASVWMYRRQGHAA